jgi:glycosyltransferase involved in cell wall biosynthesis
VSKPLISIIVNVYNGEHYVIDCIKSVLRLDGDHPLQIIVIDDASMDGTEAAIRSVADPRVEYIRLDKNVGAAAAITIAFQHVRGEYVARIDYDDRYHSNFLVDSLALLQRSPEAGFVCGAIQMIDSEGRAAGVAGPANYGQEAGVRDRYLDLLTSNFVSAPTILGRTHHWRQALPIPVGMNFCDWYMSLCMAENAPIGVIDKILADYRVHPLNMHSANVRDGTGEEITFRVLARFLFDTPRYQEVARHSQTILAKHLGEWGDRYFGMMMNADALRCYLAALQKDPRLVWRGRFLHRVIGLMLGRQRYDRLKSFAQSLSRVTPASIKDSN